MKPIDLRSDTVTRPTSGMREAMRDAEVGDDVYGEDPTVNLLQEKVAERLGKAAALLLPSGTMANQVAVKAHTQPGDAVILGADAHICLYESGAAAALSGVQFAIVGDAGFFDGDQVRRAVNPPDAHYPRTRLLCAENTHNRSGGRIFPAQMLRSAREAAEQAGLASHLDGARLFNVEVATGIPVSVWAEGFDSVSICLSKGLGAPVGSLVAGSRSFIERAHRYRKMFGGGMRQAGVLAAAGLYALEHHVKRLSQDHQNAQGLAEGLARIPGITEVSKPETNMVLFRVPDLPGFLQHTRDHALLINAIAPQTLRVVTHLDVDATDIQRALEIIRAALA